jgi:hypothetical protein
MEVSKTFRLNKHIENQRWVKWNFHIKLQSLIKVGQVCSDPCNSLEEMWEYATILFATTCDYVSFVTIFATIYQLHQIWGGFATILTLMCNLLFFSSSYVNDSKIIFIHK